MIAALISVWYICPADISVAVNNMLLFLQSVTKGYALACENLPPSLGGGVPFSDAIADQMVMFYEVNFEVLRSKVTKQLLDSVLPLIAEVPGLFTEIQDFTAQFSGLLINMVGITVVAPKEYIFPSKRHYPC